jgi:hypothetical protein
VSQTAATETGQSLHAELRAFSEFERATLVDECPLPGGGSVPLYQNEFWTARQRVAHRLHEVSYRACFKPQLPRFFIERLTRRGDVVFDPFMGRGTTLLEAALLGRTPAGCDANPLGRMLVAPRLNPPTVSEVQTRLETINFDIDAETREDLLVFYHPNTLRQLCALRAYLIDREPLDAVDQWIRMIALNRLTGHSSGFFSVYTMPPNQAVSIESQIRINARLGQQPEFRSVPKLIASKTKRLLGALDSGARQTLSSANAAAKVLACRCESVPEIASDSVTLAVTSPPFLKVVDYAGDNWLRCWFANIDPASVQLSIHGSILAWEASMTEALSEVKRLLLPGGWVAFEVGEVERGTIRLETAVLSAGQAAGLHPELVLINSQKFTKTANCWGVQNNSRGTNSNRIVLFRKAGT